MLTSFFGDIPCHEYVCNATRHVYKANAIGRSAKTVREFLEKHYDEDATNSEHDTIKLAIKALMEVVQSGSKNMEVAIMRRKQELKVSQNRNNDFHRIVADSASFIWNYNNMLLNFFKASFTETLLQYNSITNRTQYAPNVGFMSFD